MARIPRHLTPKSEFFNASSHASNLNYTVVQKKKKEFSNKIQFPFFSSARYKKPLSETNTAEQQKNLFFFSSNKNKLEEKKQESLIQKLKLETRIVKRIKKIKGVLFIGVPPKESKTFGGKSFEENRIAKKKLSTKWHNSKTKKTLFLEQKLPKYLESKTKPLGKEAINCNSKKVFPISTIYSALEQRFLKPCFTNTIYTNEESRVDKLYRNLLSQSLQKASPIKKGSNKFQLFSNNFSAQSTLANSKSKKLFNLPFFLLGVNKINFNVKKSFLKSIALETKKEAINFSYLLANNQLKSMSRLKLNFLSNRFKNKFLFCFRCPSLFGCPAQKKKEAALSKTKPLKKKSLLVSLKKKKAPFPFKGSPGESFSIFNLTKRVSVSKKDINSVPKGLNFLTTPYLRSSSGFAGHALPQEPGGPFGGQDIKEKKSSTCEANILFKNRFFSNSNKILNLTPLGYEIQNKKLIYSLGLLTKKLEKPLFFSTIKAKKHFAFKKKQLNSGSQVEGTGVSFTREKDTILWPQLNYNNNFFKSDKIKKNLQKKRRALKQRRETGRLLKRKRFYPRPTWLRLIMYRKFLKLRHIKEKAKSISLHDNFLINNFPMQIKSCVAKKSFTSLKPTLSKKKTSLIFKRNPIYPNVSVGYTCNNQIKWSSGSACVTKNAMQTNNIKTLKMSLYYATAQEQRTSALGSRIPLPYNQFQHILSSFCKRIGNSLFLPSLNKKNNANSPVLLYNKEENNNLLFIFRGTASDFKNPLNNILNWPLGGQGPLKGPFFSTKGGVAKEKPTIVSYTENEFYSVSKNVLTEFKQGLWKSSWLRANLNSYLIKIKQSFNLIKKITKTSEQDFLMETINSRKNLLANLNYTKKKKKKIELV